MSEDEKVLLIGGALFVGWFMFLRRPRMVTTGTAVAPPLNPYGSAAGYAPPYGAPRDPGDVNNYLPSLITGLSGTINGIIGAATRSGGPSTSSGTQNGDSYAGADSSDTLTDYSSEF